MIKQEQQKQYELEIRRHIENKRATIEIEERWKQLQSSLKKAINDILRRSQYQKKKKTQDCIDFLSKRNECRIRMLTENDEDKQMYQRDVKQKHL